MGIAVRRAFVAILLLLGAGCGSSRIATYPVHGRVRVDGQAAAGINVYFHPVEGSEAFRRQRPYAETDERGEFRLKTFRRDDGAPAGRYRVTFTWWERRVPIHDGTSDPERRTQRALDKLGGRYADVHETPFAVEIATGQTRLEPFELTTREQTPQAR